MKSNHATQKAFALTLIFGAGLALQAHGSSYGTLCNFDTVNDTGEKCHGFEIELEDCHSSDITRTYNYNHYGVPNITEDNSDPAHPRCFIRWEATHNPDGTWSAYTAIPDGPIDPTNGHQFTNPSVNFGGEHFGVSYRSVPSNVRYFWLVDRVGALVRGSEEVKISTPVFTYNPIAGNVVARVEPPEPVEVHLDEFGPALWVKSIKTTTHNSHKVELRDLRSDDPDDDNDVNWQNGEPAEVEIEWELLQEEFNGEGDGNGDPLDGAPEGMPGGDEIITRKWEFYQYVGPTDDENGEAKVSKVGDDGIHGEGVKTINDVEVDLSTVVVVGDYLGCQMAAFDADPKLELCDHLQDAEQGVAYPERLLVIPANIPAASSLSAGVLPTGMSFTNGILSGNPTENGEFEITVEASDANTPSVSRTYNLRVAAPGVDLPKQWTVDAAPHEGIQGGTVVGGGQYEDGEEVTLGATPDDGYRFACWTELGTKVSEDPHYHFPAGINRQVVAVFHPILSIGMTSGGNIEVEWPVSADGWVLEESSSIAPGIWSESSAPTTDSDGMRKAVEAPLGGAKFYHLCHP